MFKKAISLIIIISLLMSVIVVNATPNQPNNVTRVVEYSEKNVEKYEKEAAAEFYKMNKEKDSKHKLNDVNYAIPIPDGTVDIVTTSAWTSGTVYEDSSLSNAILSAIKDSVLTIVSYFTATVINVVKDVATIAYGLLPTDIKLTSPGAAKLSHSYSYVDKLGKVYNESTNQWIMKVDIQKRQWFRHEWASFATTEGYTRTGTVDYTADRGYSPIQEDKKYGYDDNSYISAEASYRYNTNQAPLRSTFVTLY